MDANQVDETLNASHLVNITAAFASDIEINMHSPAVILAEDDDNAAYFNKDEATFQLHYQNP